MNNPEKPVVSAERLTMLITILTIVVQAGLFLLSGGFAAGGRLADISGEIKGLRQEIQAINRVQDHRLDILEKSANK